jgi:hypothetical protein
MKFETQVEYTLLTDVFQDKLSDRVTKQLQKGWILYGQPIVAYKGTTTEYCQALVLTEHQ